MSARELTPEIASHFARIALSHVTREYPNAPQLVLSGPDDLKNPRTLHPVFYGSFDWHSCVHSYCLLATIARLHRDLPEREAIRRLFDDALTPEKISCERAYLQRPYSGGFERPYGWAWLLMLSAEFGRHQDARSRAWHAALQPLAEDFADRFRAYLPKLTYPIRSGTHACTAFALALAMEYAGATDIALAATVRERASVWYGGDADCQAWEPSGEDFLSPSLCEAECIRRVLPRGEFHDWLHRFLPRLGEGEPAALFAPVIVADRHDGRIVHLDGLNLSRAWCWRGVASALDPGDALRTLAEEAADRHLAASLPAITGDYMGEHWLATFALLALLPPRC
jgi:hypothetical protein